MMKEHRLGTGILKSENWKCLDTYDALVSTYLENVICNNIKIIPSVLETVDQGGQRRVDRVKNNAQQCHYASECQIQYQYW